MNKKDSIKEKSIPSEDIFNSASCHGFNSASCHGFNSGTFKERNQNSRVDKRKLNFDVLEWEITSSCSLAREMGPCKFCYSNSKYKRPNEMSQEERIKIVKLFGSKYFKRLIIGGGEPLDIGISNLAEIIRIAKSHGLQTFLSTSGFHFSLKSAYQLRDSELNGISISLDGSTPEIHALSRSKDSFSQAIKAIELCVKTGLQTTITMVINRFNFDDFKNMTDLALELGVAELYTIPLMPVGRGKRFQEAFLSPKMKAEHIKRVVEANLHQSKLKIEVSTPQKNTYTFLANSKSIYPLGCTAGVTDLGLLPDGTVVDCPIHRYSLGYWEDFIHGNPIEILRKNKIFNSLQNRAIQGKCGSCNYLWICGGCRAEAEALTGNPLGEELNCEFYSPKKTENSPIPFREKSLIGVN
jgi:radical SAM protein with 4Fe4S-binding SPASM domain